MNRIGTISLALALGASPFLQAGTTLSKAAIKGDVARIQACLAAGEDVNEMDKWGWTPLMWAVYYKYIPAAQCLLDAKADPNIESTLAYRSIPRKSTAITICAYYGLDDLAKLLMKAGAQPDLSNEGGKTALDYARSFGFQTMVQILTKEPPKHETAPPKPNPAPQPAPKAEPVQAHPAPTKKAPKKPAPAKKQEPTPKSEPPAIK